MVSKPFLIGSITIALLIGLCFGRTSSVLSDIEVKLEINLFEVVTIGVTIWLAVFIKMVLDKSSEKNLNISHLIAGRIKSVSDDLNETKNLVRAENKIGVLMANSLQKRLNNQASDIERILRKESKRFNDYFITSFITDFQKHTSEIKDLMTNTPNSATVQLNSDIQIVNGQYTYSGSRSALITQDLFKIESLLSNLEYSIYTL